MIVVTALHFDITGDCSSAVQALSNTESAIDRVAGKNAVFGIQASGASNAIRDLDSVSTARDRITAGGPSMLSVGVAGASGARADLRALGSDVQAASRAFSSMSSMSVGLAGASSVSQIVSDLGAGASDVARSMELVGAGVGDIDRTATQLQSNLAPAMAHAGSRARALNSDIEALGRGANAAVGDLSGFDRAVGTALKQTAVLPKLGVPGTPDGPPLPPGPPGDDGGRGRGPGDDGAGGGRFGRFGRGAGMVANDLTDAASAATGPVMMGSMIGLASSAVAAAVGVGSVMETIKHVPGLMYAAHEATGQFDRSLRAASDGALAAGKPGFDALRQAMAPLGTEVGHVGVDNMSAALSTATGLTTGATQALKNMEPVIGDSIRMFDGLGNAVLQGISSPAALEGIKGVNQALSDPGNQQGIGGLVSTLVAAGGIATSIGADTAGMFGGKPADTAASQLGWGGALAGWMAGRKFGPGAGAVTAALGATGMYHAAQQQERGQDPTSDLVGELGGSFIGRSLGSRFLGAAGGPIGMAVGFEEGPKVTNAISSVRKDASSGQGFWKTVGDALGNLNPATTGRLLGTTPSASAPASPFPSSMSESDVSSTNRYGWTQDEKGNMVPGSAASDRSQRHLAAQNLGSAALDQHAAAPPPPPPSSQLWNQIQQNRGFGSGVLPMPSSFQQQMNQMPQAAQHAMDQTQSMVNQQGTQIGNQLPAAMSQGIQSNTGQACNAAAELSQSATQCASDTLGVASPSKAFEYLGSQTGPGFAVGALNSAGQAGAATGAMMLNITDVAANYAADGGKQLGVIYGTNIVSGINTALDTKNLQGAGLAQGANSPIAQLALAALGLGGVAGNGASSWDLRNAGLVNFGAGTPAAPAAQLPTPEVHVYIDGNEEAAKRVVTKNFEDLLVRLGVQAR